MPLCQRHPFIDAHRRHLFSRVQIMPYLLEYPRVAVGGSANHHCIHAVSVKGFFAGRSVNDISITYNRNLHPRILFHLPDQRPVRLPLVHLAAGPAVYGQSLYSGILESFRQFHYNQ